MSASSRGWHALAALSRSSPRVCSQCARGRFQPLMRRGYSAAAAAEATNPTAAEPPVKKYPPVAKTDYRIRAGVILSRPPLLTRDPTPFESSFYLYQKRLNERLVSPFIQQMYFKKDTPPELDWNLKLKERSGVWANDIGRYKRNSRTAWNDEVPTGTDLGSQGALRERLIQDGELRFSDDGELIAEQDRVPPEQPMPRRTEADEKNDVRRLDRALDKTLYLVVRKGSTWTFPSRSLSSDEVLHEVAQRVLDGSVGVNMNTWMVGRAPIAFHVVKPTHGKDDPSKVIEKGSKTFFLKGRIMAGQADLKNNTEGVIDFMWLTQEELKEKLDSDYYQSIRNTFAER